MIALIMVVAGFIFASIISIILQNTNKYKA